MGGSCTVNMRKARFGLVCSLLRLTRPHEDVGDGQHRGNGQHLVAAPATTTAHALTSPPPPGALIS